MPTGILRHLPEQGAAMDQSATIIQNMNYAVRTWQIDRRPPGQHTPDDTEWMQKVVNPPRLKDGNK